MTDQEAHDQLFRLARDHVSLGGVNPPDAAEAAAGTMHDVPDEPMPDGTKPVPPLQDIADGPEMPAVAAPPPMPPPAKPMSLGPLGYQPPASAKPPVRDAEMERLQGEAKDKRSTAQLGQSITDIGERPTNLLDYAERLGGGGTSAPPAKSTLWKDYETNGEQPLKDLQARRKSEAELAAKAAAASVSTELKDPNSATAKTYRSVLLKFSPDLAGQLDAATPEQMVRIAPWLESYAKDEAEKAKASKDPHASEDKDRRALILSPVYDADLKRLHMTPEAVAALSGKGLDGLEAQLKINTTNAATVDAARQSSAISANRERSFKESDKAEAEAKAKPLVETIAQAVANGQMPVPTKTTPNAEAITARALEINPKLDVAQAETHRHVMENQATNPQRIATELAHEHMEELRKAVLATPEISDVPFWNDVKQGIAAKSGDPKYKALRMAANQVAAEVTNAYGEHNVEGQHITRELLNPNQSKEQWKSSLDEAEKLLAAKKNIYEKTAAETAPKSAKPKGDHGKVTFEGDGLREYADGFVEEVK